MTEGDPWRQRLVAYTSVVAKYMSADEIVIESAATGRSFELGLFRVRCTIGQKSLIVEFGEADMVDVAGTAGFDSRAILLAMATRGTTLALGHGEVTFLSLADIRGAYVEE